MLGVMTEEIAISYRNDGLETGSYDWAWKYANCAEQARCRDCIEDYTHQPIY